MDSEYYIQVFAPVLLPVSDPLLSNDGELQQGNAAAYTSWHTLDFLEIHDINFIDRPANARDSKIIKIVWGHVVRKFTTMNNNLKCGGSTRRYQRCLE